MVNKPAVGFWMPPSPAPTLTGINGAYHHRHKPFVFTSPLKKTIAPLKTNPENPSWLVVEPTHLKNISQNGTLPQIGVKMKKNENSNHHPARHLINSSEAVRVRFWKGPNVFSEGVWMSVFLLIMVWLVRDYGNPLWHVVMIYLIAVGSWLLVESWIRWPCFWSLLRLFWSQTVFGWNSCIARKYHHRSSITFPVPVLPRYLAVFQKTTTIKCLAC